MRKNFIFNAFAIFTPNAPTPANGSYVWSTHAGPFYKIPAGQKLVLKEFAVYAFIFSAAGVRTDVNLWEASITQGNTGFDGQTEINNRLTLPVPTLSGAAFTQITAPTNPVGTLFFSSNGFQNIKQFIGAEFVDALSVSVNWQNVPAMAITDQLHLSIFMKVKKVQQQKQSQ